jgi:hypothetical protein
LSIRYRFSYILALSVLAALVGCSDSTTPSSDNGLGEVASADYCVDGKVYLDTNGDGLLDSDDVEPGIEDVTVHLVQGDIVYRTQTDENGLYKFVVPSGDTYTLGIAPENNTQVPDFNETLWEYFTPTTPTSCQISLPPDLTKHFGMALPTEGVVEAVESGIVKTDGHTANYWKSELNNDGIGHPHVTELTLIAFLQCVKNTTLLPEFDFPVGEEIEWAYNILSANSASPLLDQLLASLLTTELNNCAAKGIVGFPGFQIVIINYAENVVIDNQAAAPGVLGLAGDSELLSTKLMLDKLNRGGGGGSVQ